MRSKIPTILAVFLSAALLLGGLFLLFRDDVGEMIQEEKIKPFVPDFTLLEVPESSGSSEEDAAEIPPEAEEKLKEQTQKLCANVDNSIGWVLSFSITAATPILQEKSTFCTVIT